MKVFENKFIDRKNLSTISEEEIKRIIEIIFNESESGKGESFTNLIKWICTNNGEFVFPFLENFIEFSHILMNKYEPNSTVISLGNSPAKIVRFQNLLENKKNIKFVYVPISSITRNLHFDKVMILLGNLNLFEYAKDEAKCYILDYSFSGRSIKIFKNLLRTIFDKKNIKSEIIDLPINNKYDDYQLYQQLLLEISNEEKKNRCIKSNPVKNLETNPIVENESVKLCNSIIALAYYYLYNKQNFIKIFKEIDNRRNCNLLIADNKIQINQQIYHQLFNKEVVIVNYINRLEEVKLIGLLNPSKSITDQNRFEFLITNYIELIVNDYINIDRYSSGILYDNQIKPIQKIEIRDILSIKTFEKKIYNKNLMMNLIPNSHIELKLKDYMNNREIIKYGIYISEFDHFLLIKESNNDFFNVAILMNNILKIDILYLADPKQIMKIREHLQYYMRYNLILNIDYYEPGGIYKTIKGQIKEMRKDTILFKEFQENNYIGIFYSSIEDIFGADEQYGGNYEYKNKYILYKNKYIEMKKQLKN